MTEAQANKDKGIDVDPGKLNFGTYLTNWMHDSVRGNVKPSMFESYAQQVNKHIIPALGKIKLKNLNPAHLQSFYRSKLDSGLSSRTVQYHHVLIHRALKQAMRWNLVYRNPAEMVDPPRVMRNEKKVLTPEQVKLFLDAATEDRLYAFYLVAIHTGCRFGELAALRWESVDLEAGKVTISRTLSGKTFSTPKTAKSRRTVKLTETAVAALRSHLTRQLEEIEGAGDKWQENGLVFASTVGTPLNRHNVTQRSFNKLLDKAGLPNHFFTFHSLRHTYATLLLAKNVNPKIVSETLGHSTIAITLDTYSHLLPTMQDTATSALEDALL